MKIELEKLILNPENPRRIQKHQEEKLLNSLLTFPEMLDIRDIIIDTENIVLGGNQRVATLKKIADMSEEEISVSLSGKVPDARKKKLLKYWKDWKKNNLTEVSQPQLTPEEREEIIIKDNLYFGEYDKQKLLSLYKTEELLGMGFDPIMFYDPLEDPTVEVARKGSKPVSLTYFSFGPYNCSISLEEYNLLLAIYDKHLDLTGIAQGFVTTIKNEIDARNQN